MRESAMQRDPSTGSGPSQDSDTTPLLSTPTSAPAAPRWSSTTLLFSILILTTCLATAAAAFFAFLLFSSPASSAAARARPLSVLPGPVVLLLSLDGFRFNYHLKSPTPNIRRLISGGTSAAAGLIPVFPTLTFPNHYSIATGLHPSSHGIINNYFLDPATGLSFTTHSHEPHWWLGEPLWATVARNGLPAATYFWAGSEVKKGSWSCPPQFCPSYNRSVPFEQRVDTVLSYFDLPAAEMPAFIALYFEDPDSQGHRVGPDDPEITAAVANMDKIIGRLIAGLEQRAVFEDVTFILLGDHGMVGTCDQKLVFLEDLSPWIDIPASWVNSLSPVLAIRPPADVSPAEVVAKMNEGLSSGKVKHGSYLKAFLKEELPERLHYSASDRIPPIIGLVEEGYMVEQNRTYKYECGGTHGYDNAAFSMRSIFVAHGPQFAKGREVPSFQNVEIYNLVTSILKIEGAPNNGSASFVDSILLPS